MTIGQKSQGCRTMRIVLPDKEEVFVCVCQFTEHQQRAFFQMKEPDSEPITADQ